MPKALARPNPGYSSMGISGLMDHCGCPIGYADFGPLMGMRAVSSHAFGEIERESAGPR